MWRRNLRIAVGTFVVLAVLGGVLWYQNWTGSPVYSLGQIPEAVRAHDYAKFEKYVDVEGVISQGLDDALSYASESMDSEAQSSAEQLGSALAQGFIQLLKPRLMDYTQDAVKRYVETGTYTPNTETDTLADALGSLPTQQWGEVDAKELKDALGEPRYVREEGKQAYVGFPVTLAGLDTTLVLEIRMREKDSYWQVAAFSNLGDYLTSVDQVRQRRVRELNAPVRRQIEQTVEATDLRRFTRAGDFGIQRSVILLADLRNTSKTDVTLVQGEFIGTDGAGETIKSVPVRSEAVIVPGDEATLRTTVDVNMFDAADTRLFELPPDSLQLRLEIHRLRVGDQLLRLYTPEDLSVFEADSLLHAESGP